MFIIVVVVVVVQTGKPANWQIKITSFIHSKIIIINNTVPGNEI